MCSYRHLPLANSQFMSIPGDWEAGKGQVPWEEEPAGVRGKTHRKENIAILSSNAYFSHELRMDLGHPVDGPGSLNTEIWGWVPGRSGSKSSNGAGHKQSQVVLCCNVQHIMKS